MRDVLWECIHLRSNSYRMTNTKVCEFSIDGMHCDACEVFIEQTIRKQSGVQKVSANARSQRVSVLMDNKTDVSEFRRKVSDQIEKQGYRIVDTHSIQERKVMAKTLSFLLALILFFLFLFLQKLNLNSLFNPESLTLTAVFLLGVFASISTCMAVVGGVAMTLSSKFAADKRNKATFVFHVSRLLGFIVLGGVIGLLGKAIVINAFVSAVLRLLVALVMFSVGAGLVGFPLPRLIMPKKLTEIFGIFDDKDGWSHAVLLGVATFFLPCAFTQSMQFYAMTTGSFISGALVMGVFALGTLPALSLVSIGAASGVSRLNKGFFGFTMGYIIMLFALLNLVSSLGTFGILPPLSFSL